MRSLSKRYGGPSGPLATIDSKLRQAWKGATVAINSCAGMCWLDRHPNYSFSMTYVTFCPYGYAGMYLVRRSSGIYHFRKMIVCPHTGQRKEIRRSTGEHQRLLAQIKALSLLTTLCGEADGGVRAQQ